MISLVISAILGFLPANAPATEVRADHAELASKIPDPELRGLTEQALQRKNHYYEQESIVNQMAKLESFAYSRVEITGVMSNDDTGEYDRNLIEEQIKPSFSAFENMGLMQRLKHKFDRFIDPASVSELMGDVVEYTNAASGVTTDNAKKKLARFQEAEINELVAHSWGCEFAYAAILNGDIPAPKKLILMGVPDNDRKKWDMLAAMTGAEVHWARADNDVVENAPDIAERIAVKAASTVDFEAKWKARCAMDRFHRTCRTDKRKPRPVIVEKIGILPVIGGHSRNAYYDVLKKRAPLKYSYREVKTAEILSLEAETRRVKKAALEEAVQEARGLIAQAREQKAISQRDHDERLRHTLIEMAQRSCADPGSVTQAELDALPDPYQEDFKTSQGTPRGLDICAYMVYLDLGRGVNSEKIRAKATPSKPADTRPIPPGPQRAPTIREPVDAGATVPFNSVFPLLKDLAMTACASPAQVSVDAGQLRRSARVSFSRIADDAIAASLSTGLGYCPRQLFYTLIETLRAGQGSIITDQWVRSLAAVYSTPPYVPPSSGGRCEEYGNVHCPH